MSLDTIEFIISVEKSFSIVIEDKHAEKLAILGEIAQHVKKEVKNQNQEVLELNHVMNVLGDILHDSFGVDKNKINPNAHLVYDLNLD